MNLYELTGNYNQLLEMVENEEATMEDIQDTLAMLDDDIEVKAENIGRLIKNLEAESTALKTEEERFSKRRKINENRVAGLKEYLSSNLIALNKSKLDTEHFKYSFRKSTSVTIEDTERLPEEFVEVKTTKTPNKKLIKEAIERGDVVEGASLLTKQNLQMR